MATINLMPWRQDEREERKKEFIMTLIFAGLVVFGLIAMVHMWYAEKIDMQSSINAQIKKETKKIDKRIKKIKNIEEKKASLLTRMDVIQRLQLDRPKIVKLFNTIVSVVPGGVYYISLKRKGISWIVEGRAESNSRVSELMRKMKESELLQEPSLSLIKSDKESLIKGRFFSLKAKEKER